jgi:hypothetical protein
MVRKFFNLYRVAAYILALAILGHTLGGMLGTAQRGPDAGPDADAVLATMKSVHFTWHGSDCTWYGFWLGNGLALSAVLVLAWVVLWVLGGMPPSERRTILPLARAATASLLMLAALGFVYFGAVPGGSFGLAALLASAASIRSTIPREEATE